MSFEIDIRAVGKETTSGDAIAIRYGIFGNPDSQRVIVVDGGFQEDGDDLISFITSVYNTTRVDLMISTHPHDDHVNGLHRVFEELNVRALWMHRPWLHADSLRAYVEEGRITTQAFSRRLKASLDSAHELEQLAIANDITPVEPFTGLAYDNTIFVIGPTEDYYNQLICEFGEDTTAVGRFTHFFEAIPQAASQIRRSISEAIEGEEQLVEPAINDVSARNNSSAIMVVNFENRPFLLTSDAGVPALAQAANYANSKGYNLGANVFDIQIPHHGSKRNVGPTILNHLVGLPGSISRKRCFISASKEWDTKHPSMRVTNALNRRGASVTSTQGSHLYFYSNDLSLRPNWRRAEPIPFAAAYEEED